MVQIIVCHLYFIALFIYLHQDTDQEEPTLRYQTHIQQHLNLKYMSNITTQKSHEALFSHNHLKLGDLGGQQVSSLLLAMEHERL